MSVIFGTSANDTITPALITTGVTGSPTPFPTDSDDEIHGLAGNDNLNGGGGSDFLFGDDFQTDLGNDTLDGGAGADFLFGAGGNDTYIVDNVGDQIENEQNTTAGGIDTVKSSVISVNLNLFDSGANLENITLTGSANLNATGNAKANVLTGNNGNNALLGGLGNDNLLGGNGNDNLQGQDGKDTLRGQAGTDHLNGGTGADVLIGGAGQDVFQFKTAADSTPAAADQLTAGDGGAAFDGPGSKAGDIIDVSALDANTTTGGDQAFLFGGGAGKGHLSLIDSGADTIVRGNTDNDAAFEFQLVIHDGSSVHASAYSAADFLL